MFCTACIMKHRKTEFVSEKGCGKVIGILIALNGTAFLGHILSDCVPGLIWLVHSSSHNWQSTDIPLWDDKDECHYQGHDLLHHWVTYMTAIGVTWLATMSGEEAKSATRIRNFNLWECQIRKRRKICMNQSLIYTHTPHPIFFICPTLTQ
jgi:hypothetical protein